MAKKKTAPKVKVAAQPVAHDTTSLSSGTLLIVLVFFALVLLTALLRSQGL